MAKYSKDLVLYSPQTLPSVGGLQYVVHYWADELSRRGYRVVVLSQTIGADLLNQSYEVWVHSPILQQRKLITGARAIIMFNVSLKALPSWLGTGTSLFISHQSDLWYNGQPVPLRQRLKQWISNTFAAGQIACSAWIARHYHNCQVVYNPIRVDLFTPVVLPFSKKYIFFAGRLVTDKGVDLLLEAFNLLQQSHLPGDCQLYLAGDGPEKENLLVRAAKLGINSSVKWLGMLNQNELVEYMQQAAVMVVPSRMEPMGMVVAEGLACGCRMVVSNQGGMPEVGGPFCRYFESENVESLANAIREQLSKPLPVSADLLHKHLEKFSIEYSVSEVEKWLEAGNSK